MIYGQKTENRSFLGITHNQEIIIQTLITMGERVQDYSRIQDFEADFPLKVSLKMLNSVDNDSFSDIVSVDLKVFDH